MSEEYTIWHALRTVFGVLVEVLFYWQLKLYAWWTRKPVKHTFLENLGEARNFEEWEAAAFMLDELLGNDLWRQNPVSKYYDYRLIYERLQAIIEAREDDDLLSLVNLLRSGLVRNLGNITAPTLYSRACAGTKLLIEDYITQVALAIEHVASYPTSPREDSGLTGQSQLDLLHDTRQAFGRSVLVLQGGAIFGLCHIGVVKALHLRGLLPRIIAGTATGALIAALVGVHGEDDLLEFLTGERIDLSAFASRAEKKETDRASGVDSSGWFSTLIRRVKRFIHEGYFLDVHVLEECVRDNVGDLTFEEAYAKTKRVLNITIAASGSGDMPTLLNYLTAPNVLVWSAAVASNTTSSPLYQPVTLLCKDADGYIHPWSATTGNSSPSTPAHSSPTRSRRSSSYMSYQSAVPPWTPVSTPSADPRDSPLARIAELFNVNHFVISQARPYVAPFLQSSDHIPAHHGAARSARPSTFPSTSLLRRSLFQPLLRLCALELQHRLRQLDSLHLLPLGLRRFLVDESIPGASLTLVPELTVADFWGLLQRPTRRVVDAWILRGERSVWPAVGALKVRCAVEVELDRAYQLVRRRKPMDAIAAGGQPVTGQAGGAPATTSAGNGGSPAPPEDGLQLRGSGEKRKRVRTNSMAAQKVTTG